MYMIIHGTISNNKLALSYGTKKATKPAGLTATYDIKVRIFLLCAHVYIQLS